MDLLANLLFRMMVDAMFPPDEKEHGPQSDYALCGPS